MTKLNIVLSKVEHLKSSFTQSIKDYVHFFSKGDGNFRGIKKTYEPRPETHDIPGDRESKAIVTTVKEKLDWWRETNKDYINNLFNVEATNATGPSADLLVDGKLFARCTSLELMRLIGILESGDFRKMHEVIPTRSDAENWRETTAEQYAGRDVQEKPQQKGVKTTTVKKISILKDPNVEFLKDAAKYTPVTTSEDIFTELGDWTIQHFTGEFSAKQVANILRWYTKLLVGAKEALKKANEAEMVESKITMDKLADYLHEGKI